MQAASKGTYISNKYLSAYEESRKKHQAKKMKKKADVEMKNEEEAEKKLEVIQEIGASKEKKQSLKGSSDSEDSDNYDERNRSCEEVHSDELEGELQLSDCEDNSRVMNFRARKKMQKASYKQAPARLFRQEIDTNIYRIGFKTLADQAELASGDPTECAKCKAIFNIHSKVEEVKSDDADQLWTCEFCNHPNSVDIEEEEKPKNKAVNFILEAAAQVEDKKGQGKQDISVVFCVDQSGSMCCSQQIKGKHKLKGDKTNELKEFMKFSDGSDQRMQGERDVTYVSRMQCLQAAIDQQITDMSNGAQNRKIGVVSFNNEVTVYGDGNQDPVTIGGDKLFDQEFLMTNGHKLGQEKMNLIVKDSAKQLQKKIMAMEETGPTALGPAVATAIAMAAAQNVQGSQVVICTDGLANIGLGSFDEAKTDDDFAAIEKFYKTLGDFAKEKGLTINIISIIGDDCNLDALSKLAEMTNGEVERVNPIDLTNNFSNILSQPIIASNVVAKVKLHKGMTFRNEDPDRISEDQSLMTREIGNVTADTEITFEYTMKKISELVKMEDFDLTKVKTLPFQVQITYKALDGSKCIRVITDQQDISSDRNKLEQQADFNILGQNAIQQSANICRSGNVRFAQANAKNWKRKMGKMANNEQQRSAHNQYMHQFNNVYSKMQCQEDMIQQSQGPAQGSKFSMGALLPGAAKKPIPKAKKAAPKSRGMLKMMANDDMSEESDAEDNLQDGSMGLNLFSNENKKKKRNAQKPEEKSKGSFFKNLFGGLSKGSAGNEEELSMQQCMAMPQQEQMMMQRQESEDEYDNFAAKEEERMMQMQAMEKEQEAVVVSSKAYGKKGSKNESKRMHQNDDLAQELFKAAKSKM